LNPALTASRTRSAGTSPIWPFGAIIAVLPIY
jgi:hypothetical protein